MSTRLWTYADTIAEDRRDSLNQAPTFGDIVEAVRREMSILCGHVDQCQDNNPYSRIVFSIQVSRPLFDWIFNSANGYRAWFFRSPYDGLRNNARMIRILEPKLLESLGSEQDIELARDSLNSLSAKVWLAERGNEVCMECPECAGEWSSPQDDTPEILNRRWEVSLKTSAKSGRKAPYLTKLRVFGAFLNNHRDEWISERKRHRAKQIHDFGWS
jgi:hypothetical protein